MTEPTPQPAEQPGRPSAGLRLARWIRQGGWRAIVGAVSGAGLLATYAHFVGCRTGACFLTADVHTATVVGALVGLVIGWPAPATAPGAPGHQPR